MKAEFRCKTCKKIIPKSEPVVLTCSDRTVPDSKCKVWYLCKACSKKSIVVWVNDCCLDVLRFTRPSKNEMSKKHSRKLKLLRFPRFYNQKPRNIDKRKNINYIRIKITFEQADGVGRPKKYNDDFEGVKNYE